MSDKHYIIIESEEEGDFTIEHPSTCKQVVETEGAITVRRYDCAVGSIIDWTGIEDLVASDQYEKLKQPGKYEIDAYVYTPSSMFDEAEAYIYFVE